MRARGVAMFRKVEVPILGIVENMSYFICPECGHRSDIFAHGGARHEAERLGVPFLGEVPLAMPIRETSDAGRPIVASDPDSSHAKAYLMIARQVQAGLQAARCAPHRASSSSRIDRRTADAEQQRAPYQRDDPAPVRRGLRLPRRAGEFSAMGQGAWSQLQPCRGHDVAGRDADGADAHPVQRAQPLWCARPCRHPRCGTGHA